MAKVEVVEMAVAAIMIMVAVAVMMVMMVIMVMIVMTSLVMGLAARGLGGMVRGNRGGGRGGAAWPVLVLVPVPSLVLVIVMLVTMRVKLKVGTGWPGGRVECCARGGGRNKLRMRGHERGTRSEGDGEREDAVVVIRVQGTRLAEEAIMAYVNCGARSTLRRHLTPRQRCK